MSKRRVNKQQTIRIQQIQANFREHDQIDDCYDGLVISRFGRHAEVEHPELGRIHCAIRPNIHSLVAGDNIIWQPSEKGQGVIVSCYPRTSVLGRADRRGQVKPVAANVTQLIIVIAVKPEMSWQLLDSYLVVAENLNLAATIVLNKADLPSQSIISVLNECYLPLGYPILHISKQDKPTFLPLHQSLNQQINVFVGQSGVGKSSLISEVLPHEKDILTGDISLQSELGCHTTSNSRLYHLPAGGALIDSPGVREFKLGKIPKEDIIYGFRECRPLVQACKFRNCTHIATPGCALIESVKSGVVSSKRYESLLNLISQLANNN